MLSRRQILAATAVGSAAAVSSPLWSNNLIGTASASPQTCELALQNATGGDVNAYVTGRDFVTDEWILVRADSSVYRLVDPGAPQTPLPIDCSIPVSAGGSTVTLPRMYGARIYFVAGDTLDFFVNPGPALVEPAFATPSDPNFSRRWSFCEFTFNDIQLFVNISYVDLVTALPIGLTLEGDTTTSVASLPSGAVDGIAQGLRDQAAADGRPWDQLVLSGDDGSVLRCVAPQDHDPAAFGDYWDDYVDQIWSKYAGTDLHVDIQGGRGVFTGRVNGDQMVFDDGSSFGRPNATDIFSCNSGPFTNNPGDSDVKKGILARLAAAINRSTLLELADQPGGTADDYYQGDVTNHWARIVHANSPIGYAFPYDDVTPDGQPDQSGAAFDGNPQRLTVTAG